MKTFNGFHACTVLGSILLSSLGVVCVSIERRDLGDSTQIPLNFTSLPLDTPLSTSSIDEHAALTTPLEASFNHTFTTNGVQQPRTTPIDHDVVRGGQGVNIPSTTSMQQDIYLLSVKVKESDDNALRTSTITIASSLRPDIEVNVPSATVGKATLLIPTTNEPVVSKSLEGPLFTKAADNAFEHASLSEFNTEEMLTTNPRTNIVPTGTENSTSPVLFDSHSKNTEKVAMVPSIVSPAPLTTATSVSAEQSTDVSVYLSSKDKNIKETEVTQTLSPSRGSEVSEEWDDTKLIAKNHLKFSMHENLTTSADPDPRSTAPFFENPTDTTTETIEAKDYTGTEKTPLMAVANGDILVNATDPSPKDSEAAFANGSGATLRSTNIRDMIAISTLLPDTIDHSKMKTNIYKAEVVSVVSESPHLDDTKTQAKETASKSMSTPASYASSERTLLAPSAKLESEEEGEEEREGEEEDDEDTEDDDDEDEDDEDKDVDSVDDSVEGDTELPTFTLPGLSSQEPLLEKKNQPALEEVPYRVPDTLEWEQQNQGLVRSWMEKLKDKAGYMSGMLLPVGIGIAGAFSILGALYSIKFMNRRRRLGFKRHKRKQREFNSMQDRVMLLADSSEDEF